MKKMLFISSMTLFFMLLVIQKSKAQNSLHALRYPVESNPLLKQIDSVCQKKNLLYRPGVDITKQRNLLYRPQVDGKPMVKLLEATKPESLLLIGK